ncbi:MAG: thiol-disulfide oxidoreductase [Rhodothalassiaceae bacterium]|nr:MAG: thiol-disulfide oxidoreductase [Rhodothalassiaceae bacterium]
MRGFASGAMTRARGGLGVLAVLLLMLAGLAACERKAEEPASASGAAGSAATEAGAPIDDSEVTAGIPDIVIGAPDAPLTLIEYASLTCPHCAHFAEEIYPKLKETYIDTGKVRYVFRNFILNPLDLVVTTAVRCQPQEVQWPLIEMIFARQAEWMRNLRSGDRETILSDIAAVFRRAGVSRADFDRCIADKALQQKLIDANKAASERYDIQGTPTLILNGRKLPAIGSFEELAREIDRELS